MKLLLVTLALACSLALPALAQVKIHKINVTGPEGSTFARVQIRLENTGTSPARIKHIKLQRGDHESWTTVKTWDRPAYLLPGQVLLVEFSPNPEGVLGQAILKSDYHVQVIVNSETITDESEAADR